MTTLNYGIECLIRMLVSASSSRSKQIPMDDCAHNERQSDTVESEVLTDIIGARAD